MNKTERFILKEIRTERKYDTIELLSRITKITKERIFWEAERLNIDFDEALEEMVGIACLTKALNKIEKNNILKLGTKNMEKMIKKIVGGKRGSYSYLYEEKEKDDEIEITFNVKLLKSSKNAMNIIEKAKIKKKSPAEIILKDMEKEIETE